MGISKWAERTFVTWLNMASDTKAHNQPIYRNIDGSNIEDLESTELESLCMECHEKVCITFILS